MASNVYLVEKNQERIEKIIKAGGSSGYGIKVADDIRELEKLVEVSLPEAIFLNYHDIKNQLQEVDFLLDNFTVIYGWEIDLDEKLNLYKKGITRVVELNRKDITDLFFYIRMHFFRQNDLKPQIAQHLTRGNMEVLFLREILFNNLLDRRNIILKIKDEDWHAKIRTFQGEVVEAVCPDGSGEEALLRILQHNKGFFRLKNYTKATEISNQNNSTFALLVESDYESQIADRFLNNFSGKDPFFMLNEEEDLSKISSEEKEFLQIIKRESEFNSILRKSSHSFLKSISLLKGLLEKKYILEDEEKSALHAFSKKDVKLLKENILKSGRKEGRLIVFGYPGSGKTELIKTIAGVHKSTFKSRQSVDFARLSLDEGILLSVFGISIDRDFQEIIDELSKDMVGFIFIINLKQDNKMDYYKYILHQLLSGYSVPAVVALTGLEDDISGKIMNIRNELELSQEISVVQIDPGDFSQISRLFYHLKPITDQNHSIGMD